LYNLHSSVYSNFAKKAILPEEVTSLDRIAFLAKLLSTQTRKSDKKMLTSVTPNASLCQLAINCSTPSRTCAGEGLVTPFGYADKKPVPKRKRFTAHPSPSLPHAIIDLQQTMTDVANEGKEYCMDDGLDEDVDSDDEFDNEEDEKEVESNDFQFVNDVLATGLKSTCLDSNPGFNYLVPVKYFDSFIRNNFSCKQCSAPITEANLVSVRVGCACNVFWQYSNQDCESHAERLAKKGTTEVSEGLPQTSSCYWRLRHQPASHSCVPTDGWWFANGIHVLWSGVMSILRRSGWNRCFTTVEEQIGKAIILLGEIIIKKNLENEIAESPRDSVLKKAKLTLMTDGGGDQRASGKAYNSSSGHVVSIGGCMRRRSAF
jgi:hypothetical protein